MYMAWMLLEGRRPGESIFCCVFLLCASVCSIFMSPPRLYNQAILIYIYIPIYICTNTGPAYKSAHHEPHEHDGKRPEAEVGLQEFSGGSLSA
jgi:hypothetical protein